MHGCLVRLMCRFEQCDRLVMMTAEATIQVVVILPGASILRGVERAISHSFESGGVDGLRIFGYIFLIYCC